MTIFKQHAPLHVLEGSPTKWKRWFAWRPVRSEQGGWIWLSYTWRRWFYPPSWFCPPAPIRWREYSDTCFGWWELPAVNLENPARVTAQSE